MYDKYVTVKEDRVEIEKTFAEQYLSIHALYRASLVSDVCYSWALSGIHYILYYELPSMFSAHFVTLVDLLTVEAPDYLEAISSNLDGLHARYRENHNKFDEKEPALSDINDSDTLTS